ncbi:MAG TPA: hypothetical protein VLU92_12285 [Candidatus Dormibacteraeota bacterium]|nr:hypothetical protein [Candidatus Dormibacteraeota bacterium]
MAAAPPPLLHATFGAGAGDAAALGESEGLGDGLATAGAELGDGECTANALEGPGAQAQIVTTTPARPISRRMPRG